MVGVLGMNAQQFDDWADRKSESGILKLIARWGMIASIPVMMGITTWVGSTLWSMNTEAAKFRGEVTGRIDVLTERIGTSVIRTSDVELGFKLRDQRIEYLEKNDIDMRRTLVDHGTRILQLERK